jgi:glyoxylase-like metal-dependent hydrolase (beta-lactamase superfamily II)
MDVLRVDDGLWRWSTMFAEWGHEVGCVYLEADDAIVLIDPLVPEEAGEEERFWRALDRDVARSAVPMHVLVTVFWHTRSAARMVERYDARVHAVSGARAAVERRSRVVHETFRPGGPLPGGVVAYATSRANEVVYWIPAHRALVPGDVILGAEDGGLRLCPVSWLPQGHDHARLLASLEPLRALPVERVLVSHGTPVLEGGGPALERLFA